MPRTPQLILSLGPEGLQTELPGAFATRRKLVLHGTPEQKLATIERILEALGQDLTEIGLDGAPTEAQVRHWERHEIWPDTRCAFCQREGRFGAKPQRERRRVVEYKTAEGVEVRRIKARVSGLAFAGKSDKVAGDLGL